MSNESNEPLNYDAFEGGYPKALAVGIAMRAVMVVFVMIASVLVNTIEGLDTTRLAHVSGPALHATEGE